MKFLLALILVFTITELKAQQFNCANDINFLINRYTKDYSGFKDFTDNNHGYQYFIDSIKKISANESTVMGCDALIKSIIEYFNNKHVFYGSTVNNPYYKEEVELNTGIPIDLKPMSRRSVYVKVGSSDIALKDTLLDLLRDNYNKIKTSDNLIIDLRGNGGGSDAVLNTLLPYIYTQPIISHNLELWSSENNIKLFKDLLGNEHISNSDKEIIRKIVATAKEHPDQFISINGQKADTIRFPEIMKYPKRIKILIDEKCMSATENFLLKAKQSSKVKIYGHSPTAGGVDYGDLNFVTLPSGYWFISVPTTRTTRLPQHKVDNIGIHPDVLVSKDEDLLKFVLNQHN